jgi:hypothetical protein
MEMHYRAIPHIAYREREVTVPGTIFWAVVGFGICTDRNEFGKRRWNVL